MLERYFTPYQATSAVSGDRIAILAPHPDDEVFGCGGSACKWGEQGKVVQAFIITSGVVAGEFADDPDAQLKRIEKASLRAEESRAAAQILGLLEPEFFERQDAELLEDEMIQDLLLKRLSEWQPSTLVVPSIWEMHRDHRATAQIGMALAKQLETVQRLVFYEVGVPITPNCLEDITDYQTRKWQAMQEFSSQLSEQHYAEQINGLNSFRSYTLGLRVRFAEAFFILEKSELDRFSLEHRPDQMTLVLKAAEQHTYDQGLQKQRIEELEMILQQTHQSLSWRITRPLRWLRRIL